MIITRMFRKSVSMLRSPFNIFLHLHLCLPSVFFTSVFLLKFYTSTYIYPSP